MRGTARERFCARCQKSVHNLAQMSPTEIEVLAMKASAGFSVCGRVTRLASAKLVMLESPSAAARPHGRAAALSAALLASVPAAAQVSAAASKHEAVLTGQLRKPDGSPVESGLIQMSGPAQNALFVADDRGRFELHVAPGSYDITVITAEDQAEQVRVAGLHEGLQELGQVRTEAGQRVLVQETTTTTVGVLVSTVRWSWKARLHHPLLYVRSLVRRRS